MSKSGNSSFTAIQQFVDKVNDSNIVRKQNELKEIINGPLALAREKGRILETDEAHAVLNRIDLNYQQDLVNTVQRIFDQEVERGSIIINEINVELENLKSILETVFQRLHNEKQKLTPDTEESSIRSCQYEDARFTFVYLKLKSDILRQYLFVPFDEHCNKIAHSINGYIDEGDFLLRLISGSGKSTKMATFNECKPVAVLPSPPAVQRVIVFENGSNAGSRVIPILPSMEQFLQRVCDDFRCPEYKLIYTTTGAVISDVNLMRNDEVLYISKGEPFSPPELKDDSAGHCGDGSIACSFQRRKSLEWIKLNVGGQLFYTSRTTLLNSDPDSMLARMFAPNSNLHPSCIDSNGAYLIDRDPRYFSPLLNYLRSGILILDTDINPKGVLEEAYFFNIQSCIPLLEPLVIPRDEAPLTRRDVINALIVTPNKDSLRFQGVNLNGADLSYLDLRNINFKYAKLRNAKLSYCNLSFCNFERADMTDVMMNCAVLSGVRLNGAIMENAKCLNCNFQDPSGNNANMEGVNLRNAALEDSDLTGANLRVANLKGANLKATILRGAILAGADLEKSDLTGSDLHEANLRGANLKDAALELMINPLHMSQAIR